MTSGAPWWVVLAGTALGGLLGVFGTIWATAKDNKRARREEWFRRVQWAESLTGTDDPQRRATGFRVLDAIARRDLSSDVAEDRALIDALDRPLDAFELASTRSNSWRTLEATTRRNRHDHPTANGQTAKRVVKVGPDIIAAAQLRETLDKLPGRTTSPVIEDRPRPKRLTAGLGRPVRYT